MLNNTSKTLSKLLRLIYPGILNTCMCVTHSFFKTVSKMLEYFFYIYIVI